MSAALYASTAAVHLRHRAVRCPDAQLQNYSTTEATLRREFERFGPIRKVIMVKNSVTERPRGYAFVEFEHERDLRGAPAAAAAPAAAMLARDRGSSETAMLPCPRTQRLCTVAIG